jgi:dTDP-4-dehydrorhamnose 3,5-epimerase
VELTKHITNNNTKVNMPFIETPIKDLLVFEPRIFNDDRGYFYESFNQKNFIERGIDIQFVQDNQAYSTYGVARGLHFQYGDAAQAKLVSVLQGAVLDVVVDLRNNSETFGQSYAIELNAENKKQLLVPRGFAHGYSVLSETALFYYKCDNFYNKSAEGGIQLLDNNLAIDWQVPHSKMIISEKDVVLPNFDKTQKYF